MLLLFTVLLSFCDPEPTAAFQDALPLEVPTELICLRQISERVLRQDGHVRVNPHISAQRF